MPGGLAGGGGGDDINSRIQVIIITSPNTAMGFLGLVAFLSTYILERRKGLYREILGAELQLGTSKEMTTKATKLIIKNFPSVIRLI